MSNVEVKTEKRSRRMSYGGTLVAVGIILAVLIGNGALIAWPWSIVAGSWVWLILLSVSFVPVIIYALLVIAWCVASVMEGRNV